MSLTVFLDTGPLGLVTNPKKTTDTIAAAEWVYNMEAAGHRLIVPAIADYEVRRELVRNGKSNGLARLDAFNTADTTRLYHCACERWPPVFIRPCRSLDKYPPLMSENRHTISGYVVTHHEYE